MMHEHCWYDLAINLALFAEWMLLQVGQA